MMELNGPIDAAVEFEKEMHALVGVDAQDLEGLIADALKRQGKNDRMTAIHMHLRLKNGANARPHAMNRHELADLVEMFASNGAANTIVKRLANFYARIAQLRARIVEINSTISGMDLDNDINAIHAIHAINAINAIHCKNGNMDHLLASYAKNEGKRREKQNANQRELARIMESAIHPDLTEDDLRALEIQVDHIVERGFTTEEMRRLQIIEAALEQQKLDELLDELKRETRGSPR